MLRNEITEGTTTSFNTKRFFSHIFGCLFLCKSGVCQHHVDIVHEFWRVSFTGYHKLPY